MTSSVVSAEDDAKPSPPVGLTATASTDGATLTWEAPLTEGSEPLTGYNVYSFSNTTRVLIGSVNASTTTFVDANGDGGEVYYVTAVNGVGQSMPSNLAPLLRYPYCPPFRVTVGPPWFEFYQDCLLPPPVPPIVVYGQESVGNVLDE